MESLSGPLHSRKLSNDNSFSSKNAYEGVFSGQKKFAASNFSTRVEDYREIFGSSHGSSIPVLDLSGFDDSNGSSNLKSAKPDYSKIFGGFRDDDAVMSYEELFGRLKNSPEKARTPFGRRQPSQDSEDLFDTSNQTAEAMKQFNMSYHKTTRRIKDGSPGTTHVAQMHDVPAFTCFVDEIKMAPPKKTEAETQKTSATNGVHSNVVCSEGGPEVKDSKRAYEQTTESAGKSKSRYSRGGSFSDDKLFNAHKINLKSHPSKLPSPSCMPPNLENHRAHSNGSAASNSGASKVDIYVSDEELDVNSAAAASGAALRKAIEKAQESIRIAKESVGRKKEGLRSFLNRSFKDSLKVEERETSDNNVEGTCERVGAASKVFASMERKNAGRGGLLQPDFTDGEKLFVARKVIDEIHGKISESARSRERSPLPALGLKESEKVPVPGEVLGETSWKNLESVEELEAATGSFDWVNAEKGRTVGLAFEPAVNINDILESAVEYGSELKEIRTTNETLEAATGSFEGVNAEKGRTVELAFEPAVNRNDIFESTVECESELKEIGTTSETLEEQAVKNLETVEMACELEDTKGKQNAEVKLHGPESECVVDEERENELPGSKLEEEANMEKPQGFYKLINFVKNLGGFVETMEDHKKVSNKLEDEDYKVRVNDACKFVEDENELKDTQEMMVNEQKEHHYEKRLNQAPELFEIGKQQQEVFEEEYIDKAENENGPGKNCDHNVNEKIVEEVSEWVEHEPKEADESHERKKDDVHKEEAIEKWLEEVHELEISEKAYTYAHDIEENEVRLQEEFKIKQEDDHKGEETEKSLEERDANDEKGGEETLKEKCGWAGHDLRGTEDYVYKERGAIQMETDGNEENGEIEIPQKVAYEEIFYRYSDAYSRDACIAAENQDTHKVKVNDDNMEARVEANDSSPSPRDTHKVKVNDDNMEARVEANDSSPSPRVTKTFCEFKEETAEAVEVTNKVQEKEIFEAADQISIEDDEKEFEVKEVDGALSSYDHVVKFGLADKEVGENEIGQIDEQLDLASDGIERVSNESIEIEEPIKEVKIAFFEEGKNIPKRAQEEVEGSHLLGTSKEKEKTVEIKEELKRNQYREKTGENLYRTMEKKKAKETEVKRGEEKKQIREMDEATKKEREREKDRIAVERAIREARERAFAEARERAERAAVERATAEVRQRVMAEAREKIERVSAGTTKSSSEKASAEAKIRAERAAVERVTAEARERALQKAMSQKTTTSEQFVAEKFSGASKDHGTRQSSSSDIHSSNGTNSESAQRNKARLERHNRIMERAANALAEKEKRDMLVQKEQAERNRLAETLDAEIKRWSSGKEGNLRALLSTLQYILGSNSGWQPVSLTEIITTSAVKKAYRKATLAVHPDKLQQRGASIQQKYICEKVFDLLKAAWNKFNSEER